MEPAEEAAEGGEQGANRTNDGGAESSRKLAELNLVESDDAALRLAVVLAASVGDLSPLDLAAFALAFPGRHAWAEEAAEAAVRGTLPKLVDAHKAWNPIAPPFNATSWRAVHRRAHCAQRDQRLAIAADVGCYIEREGEDDGALWTWGTDHFGCLGDGGESDAEEDDGVGGGSGSGSGSRGIRWGSYATGGDDDAPSRRCTPRRVKMKVAITETTTATTSGGAATSAGTERAVISSINYSQQQRQQQSASTSATVRFFCPRLRVTAVAVGGAHVVCADDGGGVWTWGRGINGQLGRALVPRRRRHHHHHHHHTGDEESDAEAAEATFDPRPTRVPGFGGFGGFRDSEHQETPTSSSSSFALVVAAGNMHTAGLYKLDYEFSVPIARKCLVSIL
jgi:alpha-tubulin suppressor-like RCC1 family protein